jgi:hypothetical protein
MSSWLVLSCRSSLDLGQGPKQQLLYTGLDLALFTLTRFGT